MRGSQQLAAIVVVLFVPGLGCRNSDSRRSHVSAVSPATGLESGGTAITITGKGFRSGATVTIGGVAATSVVVVDAKTITAVTPAGAVGGADVQVMSAGRSSTIASAFTYLTPPPNIVSVSPSVGPASGGTSLTLTGTNLQSTTSVALGGTPATSFTVINSSTLTLVTPTAPAGTVDVTVTADGGTATLANGFTYVSSQIFVSNLGADIITVYNSNDDGDVAPTRAIAGGNTGISSLIGMAIGGDELFVTAIGEGAVIVFGLTDDGDVAPRRTIVGSSTQLFGPTGLFVDMDAEEIFVPNVWGGRVTVYDLNDAGDVAPKRMISGGVSGIANPEGLVVDDGELFVIDAGATAVLVYGASDDGDIAPRRRISGGNTMLSIPQGLCVANGEIFVADAPIDMVFVFGRNDDGDVAPLRTIAGASTGLIAPQAVFVKDDELFVASSNDSILVFDLNDFGDVAPKRAIAGASTECHAPEGLAVH